MCKTEDSLKRKVAELKNVLATREEINKKQKQLAKMLAVDAHSRFKKASAEASALTEELKICKSKCSQTILLPNLSKVFTSVKYIKLITKDEAS